MIHLGASCGVGAWEWVGVELIHFAASFIRKKPELCSYTPRHSRNEKCSPYVLCGKVSVGGSSRFGG